MSDPYKPNTPVLKGRELELFLQQRKLNEIAASWAGKKKEPKEYKPMSWNVQENWNKGSEKIVPMNRMRSGGGQGTTINIINHFHGGHLAKKEVEEIFQKVFYRELRSRGFSG